MSAVLSTGRMPAAARGDILCVALQWVHRESSILSWFIAVVCIRVVACARGIVSRTRLGWVRGSLLGEAAWSYVVPVGF